jgi:hypothetical protein
MIASTGEDMVKMEDLYTTGNLIKSSHYVNSIGVPQKCKNITTIWSRVYNLRKSNNTLKK